MAVTITTDATLNGQAVEATLFEDTDGDGVAENQATFSVPDGQATTGLKPLSGDSSNSYWLQFDLTTEDSSTTPQIHSATIDTSPSVSSRATTDITLNGQTVGIYVFEDTDGDGVAENQDYFEAPDGTATTDLMAVNYDSANTYWIRLELATSDSSTTPQVNSIGLEAAVQYIQAQAATLSAAGQDAAVGAGDASISADPAVASSVGPDAGVAAGEVNIQADAAPITLAPQNGSIQIGTASIQADAADLQITAENAERVFDSAHLAGTVTLDGSGVEGAEVYAIDDVESFGGVGMTNTEEFSGVATLTDANGDYTIRVQAGQEWMLAYQYEDDQGNQYNALSKPFLVP